MKILNAEQIRRADSYTIANQPVAAVDLIERAAAACANYILQQAAPQSHFTVVCGKGNNGADGLAIARMLAQAQHKVAVFILNYTTTQSADFNYYLALLQQVPGVQVQHINTANALQLPATNTTIIDAILGTGINKPVTGLIAAVIDKINKSGWQIVSVDVPAGLPADAPMAENWPVINATVTLTFQQPKFTFLLPETGSYVGKLKVLDIGISKTFISTQNTPYYLLQAADIAPLLKHRAHFSHKGTYGHTLLLCGSIGKIGAAVIAAHAALRSGTGLLTVRLPQCGEALLQTSLPEAMVNADASTTHITTLPVLAPYTSIGIGPGIGQHPQTAAALKLLIQSTPCPLVLDADALNIIALNKTWLGFLPPRTILTPHPKEFDRLTQPHNNSFDRLKTAQQLAHRHSIIIVLKGAYTATVMPDKTVWFNSSGNPALAKGGSGDALTGIITALIARGYEASDAAFTGVFLHGMAADIAVQTINPEALLATDVIAHISNAFNQLYCN